MEKLCDGIPRAFGQQGDARAENDCAAARFQRHIRRQQRHIRAVEMIVAAENAVRRGLLLPHTELRQHFVGTGGISRGYHNVERVVDGGLP